MTKLWVGLGNPEPGMAANRHNIGFMALDVIAARHSFTAWRRRFKGLTADEQARLQAVAVLTYMHTAGDAGQEAASFYKLGPEAITAFHDVLDLTPGKMRVKKGGGAAGHNGLRSMDKMHGSQDYWRIRLGIGHPGSKERVLGYVLGNFGIDDKPWLVALLDAVANAAELLAQGKPEDFMTKVALATQDIR